MLFLSVDRQEQATVQQLEPYIWFLALLIPVVCFLGFLVAFVVGWSRHLEDGSREPLLGDRPPTTSTKILNILAQTWCGVVFTLVALPLPLLCCLVTLNCFSIWSPAQHSRNSVLISGACSYMWNLTLRLMPWVRVGVTWEDDPAEIVTSDRPVIILMNHASISDVILFVSQVPTSLCIRTKTLISGFLLNMPVVGTLARSIGHLPVPFVRHDAFDVDQEKMQWTKDMMKDMLEGRVPFATVLAFFPEGEMSKSFHSRKGVTELLPFRKGGFALALEQDVEIWTLVSVGQEAFWPQTSLLGGLPSRIGMRFSRLCKSSLEAVHCEGDAAKVELADICRATMQKTATELAATMWSSPSWPPGQPCC